MRLLAFRSSLTSIALVVILWDLTARFQDNPLLPAPRSVLTTLIYTVADLGVYLHLLASIKIVGIGYLLSLILALPAALLCSRIKPIANILLPSHEFIRYIPVPAFVPLAAAFFGIGDLTKVSLIFVGTYFQLIFLFIGDLSAIPHEIEESARTLGLKHFRLLYKITIPAALYNLLNTARITFAWAWSYLLVAEVVNARRGIGYLVLQAYRVLNMERLIALLVLIGLFGIVVDSLFRLLTRVSCPWYHGKEYTTST